jgi:hypothetical protein
VKKILVPAILLLLVLVGCQPGTEMTAAPTQTNVVEAVVETTEAGEVSATALPTETPIPATETPAPATETLTPPTETPAPTATYEPLPEVSLETLTGIWTHFDAQAGGNNWLILNADGSYQGKHGPTVETGVLVLEGNYRVDNNVITFTDNEDCSAGEAYDVRFVTADRIAFDLKQLCEGAQDQLLPEQRGWQRDEDGA